MNCQECIITQTRASYDDLFRTARAVPRHKLEWQPLDAGRSVLSQVQECATVPAWHAAMHAAILDTRQSLDVTPQFMEQASAERARMLMPYWNCVYHPGQINTFKHFMATWKCSSEYSQCH